MPQKGLLPTEEKVQIVEAYISGETGATAIERQYSVGWKTLRRWVRLYKMRGKEGLRATVRYRKYSSEVKVRAVEEYKSGVGSLSYLCEKYDISDEMMLKRWIKRYNSHGAFKETEIGGINYMTKGRKTTLSERIEIVSYCIANKKDYGKTMERYNISYQQIYGWIRKYETESIDGLSDRRGKRKSDDSMTEVEKLRAQLKLKEADNLRLQMENELLKKLAVLERG